MKLPFSSLNNLYVGFVLLNEAFTFSVWKEYDLYKHGWSHFRILLHFYYISVDDTERHKHYLIIGKACHLDSNFHSSLIALSQST